MNHSASILASDQDDEKGFGMALIRIRYCREDIKNEISSSFVLPFVSFTRTGSYLNSTPNLLARDRRAGADLGGGDLNS